MLVLDREAGGGRDVAWAAFEEDEAPEAGFTLFELAGTSLLDIVIWRRGARRKPRGLPSARCLLYYFVLCTREKDSHH